jgi:hypothetical protein
VGRAEPAESDGIIRNGAAGKKNTGGKQGARMVEGRKERGRREGGRNGKAQRCERKQRNYFHCFILVQEKNNYSVLCVLWVMGYGLWGILSKLPSWSVTTGLR